MSIKSIKEKELLVNFARAMGQEVDQRLVEDVERINAIRNSVRASVSENIFKDLGTAVTNANAKYEPDDGPLTKLQIEQIKESVKEAKNELVQTQPKKESPETKTSVSNTSIAEQTIADSYSSKFLK
jgi:hypothetical protein